MPNPGSRFNDEDVSAAEEPYLDLDKVERIKNEALIQSGYFITDDDDEVRASPKALQGALVQVMESTHTVRSKRDLAAKAVTAWELYQELIPAGPGVTALPESLEEAEAQKQLSKLLWGYANTGINSHVQKQVAGLGLILCEALVARTKVNEQTGARQPGTELGRFLTADGELIMTYYTGPAGAAFMRSARKLNAQLGLVADRRPELAASVAKQLSSVVKQAVAAIPLADPKATNARQGTLGAEAEDA